MKRVASICVFAAALLVWFLAANGYAQERETEGWRAEGANGAVATGSRLAADAGLEMLQADGNAVDAAVATLLVQSVTESSLVCFGGEVPLIIYDTKRNSVEVVVGLGASPHLATTEWFNKNRKGVIQGRGDIANSVVPSFLDACLTALDLFGSRTFTECAQPMTRILRQRAGMTPEQVLQETPRRGPDFDAARWIADQKNLLTTIERLTEAEFKSNGDRSRGLRLVADYFYRGPITKEIDAWSRASGGLLRYSDLAQHHTRIEDPLTIEFQGHTICKCGAWSQGPFALQTLKFLQGYDLAALQTDSADYIHLVTEAMKLCFADRDAFFGDPDFVEVPIERLLSDDYLALRRSLLTADAASTEQIPGDPSGMKARLGVSPRDHRLFSGHSSDTSNCLVADRWGNVVAATPSGWGGVMAGDTGVQLGSRMIGLTCWESHPSELIPGKRPRITLTPTLVLKDGKPVFAVSVAGGDQQDQATIQILLNRLVFHSDPDKSVRAARFGTDHHINWFGHEPAKLGSLTVPQGLNEVAMEALRRRGHQITVGRPAATAVVLAIDPQTGMKAAVGESGRNAAAY